MPEPDVTHPSLQELASYSQNRLEDDSMRQVQEHLQSCSSCQQTLSTLTSDTLNSVTDRTSSASGDQLQSSSRAEQATVGAGEVAVPLNEFVSGFPAELTEHHRYKPLALLGQGGMGSVYKAEHLVMGRIVALKVIRPELSRPDMVERFRREIRAAAKLNHPNIVTAHDAEQQGGIHFLVIEFVDGDSLDRVVANEGCLGVGKACELIRQAAIGVHHAFEQGMVHRDLKPQNLMLTNRGVLKILDFGLARVFTDDSLSGSLTGGGVMGTPDYMAPEQADNPHDADTRADVYSLCCTLYFLLRGEPPFPEGSVVQKLMAHIEKEPPSIKNFRADVPAGLCRVLSKGMSKNPDDRFAEPGDLAKALTAYANAKDTRVDLVPAAGKSPKPIPIAQLATAVGGATQPGDDILDAIIEVPIVTASESALLPPVRQPGPQDDSSRSNPPSDAVSESGSETDSVAIQYVARADPSQSKDPQPEGLKSAVPIATVAGSASRPQFILPPEKEGNRETASIVALWMGLITLLFAWIPGCGFVALPFSLLGIGLAVFSLVMVWGDPDRRRRPAVAAVVVCLISVLASVGSIIWLSALRT